MARTEWKLHRKFQLLNLIDADHKENQDLYDRIILGTNDILEVEVYEDVRAFFI